MPLSDIIGLTANNTFSTLFDKNNEMIERLNLLDISSIIGGTGITLSLINNSGGVTVSIDVPSIATDIVSYVNNTSITISGSLPTGLTLGSIVGSVLVAGDTYGWTSCNNSSLTASNRMIGIISTVTGSSSWKISTSGVLKLIGSIAGLTQHSLYYLNAGSTYTTTIPTTEGTVIKPVLYTFGIAADPMGLIINSPGALIPSTITSTISSARSVAEIYGGGVSAGNPIYYDVIGATWAKSIANDYAKSEVFGIIESITGLTATVVMHGSIKLPTTNQFTSGAGGSGGNDIWFLSGTTAGGIQNTGPTLSGTIVKPLYYEAPHSLSGVTFTGTVVNYIGYRNN